MTYEESANLMIDIPFRNRIKVACLVLAEYFLNEAPNTPSHNSRYKFGQNIFQGPDAVALQVQPPVVMDPQVQLDGPNITDEALKTAVEGVINKII